MDAGELAAVVLSVSAAIAVVGLLFALGSVIRTMTVFRRSVEEITRQTLPLIADAHVAVKQASSDLRKVDTLLDTAESISGTVDSASRLAYTAFSSPVMKMLAVGSGAARAVRRIRNRRATGAPELSAGNGFPGRNSDRARLTRQRATRALGR